MALNSLLVFWGIVSAVLAAISPSTDTCSGASCSPDTCQNVDNSACTFTDPGINWANLIGGVSCKQCSQSTDSRCTTSNLESVFDTSSSSSIKAAYCNDNFLVVWSAGKPKSDDTLAGVPRPPGGGGGSCGYACECVTRSTIQQSQAYKIPLTPPPDGSTVWQNTPPSGATGVAIDGVPLYPGLDNGGHWVWDACEADLCNAHVGRGGDYHYHGDPYGTSCVYTGDAYTNNDPHSKILGFALDGYTVYGRYTAAGQEGIDVDLDNCGGHIHTTYNYHYHPSVETRTGTGSKAGTGEYTAWYLGPKSCFKGDVSQISNYYADASKPYVDGTESGQPNYDNSRLSDRYNVATRTDYEDLKPCCSMTDSWAVSGVTFDTTGSATSSTGIGGGSSNSGSSSYTWTTANTNSYMCAAGTSTTGRTIACAQSEYPGDQNDASVSCGATNIECFLFASVGKVGGSCAGDEFKEDGDIAHMPQSVGAACQGQSSCTITSGSSTLNGVSLSFPGVAPNKQKFKVLALCTDAAAPTPTPTPAPTPTPTPKGSASAAKSMVGFDPWMPMCLSSGIAAFMLCD